MASNSNEQAKAQQHWLLGGYRVLDLTDEKGFVCGCFLGEMGADVIKIEPPGGDRSRNISPFYHDTPDPEKSLYWFAYNTNKRGITLNIETVDGKEILKKLVRRADFVIESFPPGYADELGLGYASLSEVNSGIIMASITPFGQSGPYRDYKSCDIVEWAMGGNMYMSGDSDRPPVRVSFAQSCLHAGIHAAAGIMIALYYRQRTGEGQYIDVSIQEAVVRSLVTELAFWEWGKLNIPRLGQKRHRGTTPTRVIWPCKDGEITFWIALGALGRRMEPLVEWMKQEGMAGILEEVKDWRSVDVASMPREKVLAWEEQFIEFFLHHTKEELAEFARQKNLFIYPASSPADILSNPQLEARDFWVEVNHPELGAVIRYPGVPCKITPAPLQIRRRAPLIGEHNEEIYISELGFSKEDLIILKENGIV